MRKQHFTPARQQPQPFDPKTILQKRDHRINAKLDMVMTRIIGRVDYEPFKKHLTEKPEIVRQAVMFYTKVVFIDGLTKKGIDPMVHSLIGFRLKANVDVFIKEHGAGMSKAELERFGEIIEQDNTFANFATNVLEECGKLAAEISIK